MRTGFCCALKRGAEIMDVIGADDVDATLFKKKILSVNAVYDLALRD